MKFLTVFAILALVAGYFLYSRGKVDNCEQLLEQVKEKVKKIKLEIEKYKV